MMRHGSGLIVFLAGVALMVFATLGGKLIISDLKAMGVESYLRSHGAGGIVMLTLFSVGFPLGSAVAVIGALVMSQAARVRVWAFVATTAVALSLTQLVPIIFGVKTSPAFFAIGGSLIMVIFIALVWHWSTSRAGSLGVERTAADLQMIGYLCFVIAAWYTCGLGGAPAFALYPDKMAAFNTLPMAVALMKTIMVFLVLGWVSTLWSFYKKAGAVGGKGGAGG